MRVRFARDVADPTFAVALLNSQRRTVVGATTAHTDAAPGVFRAARRGMMLSLTDGWFDAWFLPVWQVALFLSLGESISAYGGAMALAARGITIASGASRRRCASSNVSSTFSVSRSLERISETRISAGASSSAPMASSVDGLAWIVMRPA